MPAAIKDGNGRMPCPFADFIIIEIMGRRNLHSARAFLWIGVIIRDNLYTAVHDGQDYVFTDKACITLVIWMHSNARITEHSFRARRCDNNIVARFMPCDPTVFIFQRVLIGHAIRERISQMPIMPVDSFRFDFKVGNRCLEMRVPIHQALVTVDQARFIHLNEGLGDGFGHFIRRVLRVA